MQIELTNIHMVGILLIILKIANVINCGWFWVLLPFWLGYALVGIILIVILLFALVITILSKIFNSENK